MQKHMWKKLNWLMNWTKRNAKTIKFDMQRSNFNANKQKFGYKNGMAIKME